MEFRVLGPLDVLDGGEPVYLRPGRLPRLTLAVLLAAAGTRVSVDALVHALWGDDPPASARKNLQQYVQQLRAAVGAERIVGGVDGGYAARTGPGFDADRFQELAAEGLATLDRGDASTAAVTLRAALDLWRGPAFEGFEDCPPVAAEGTRLERLRHGARVGLIRAGLAARRPEGVLPLAADLAGQHPFDETVHALLLVTLFRCGRRADALQAFRDVRDALRDQLGVEPGARLKAVHSAILVDEDPGDDATPAVPRQLPPTTEDFTGRDAAVAALLGAAAGGRDAVVVVSAVDGMAGVGKTTLAVHAAHRVAASFPDGQLFLDLHGFTAGQEPTRPGDALDVLLRALGVPGERIPDSPAERAALWRSETAGRRLLLVLDNAADAGQIRTLIPGAAGCLVLITSRRRLPDLAGARPLSLDVFTRAEAVELFTRIVGARAHAEPEAAAEVVDLCGHLPLAVRLAAARLAHRPAWTVAHLAARLREQPSPLAELSHAERSVAVTFGLSYDHLSGQQRAMFRFLGLTDGADIGLPAAAALCGLSSAAADQLLESLLDVHLVRQQTAGRYAFHDLLRGHARALTQAADSDTERRQATHRLLDYYLCTADRAADVLAPGRRRVPIDAEYQPAEAPATTDHASALAWFDTEQTNLIAAVAQAADDGFPRHAWLLPRTLAAYFTLAFRPGEFAATLETAVAAAASLADHEAELLCRLNLTVAYWQAGRSRAALDSALRGLALAQRIGDPVGVGFCSNHAGVMAMNLGRYQEAAAHFHRAVEIQHRTGNADGEAEALSDLSHLQAILGDLDAALRTARNALTILDRTGNRRGQCTCLIYLASAAGRLGDHEAAEDQVRRALAIAEEIGAHNEIGDALRTLAWIRHERGHGAEARDHATRALEILQIRGNPISLSAALNTAGLLLRADDPAGALRHHRRALTIAVQAEHRLEQARAHDGIAQTAAGADDEVAVRHAAVARSLYRSMVISA